MKQQPSEKELKELVTMVKDFEAQIKDQSETARKIAIKYNKVIKKSKNQQ